MRRARNSQTKVIATQLSPWKGGVPEVRGGLIVLGFVFAQLTPSRFHRDFPSLGKRGVAELSEVGVSLSRAIQYLLLVSMLMFSISVFAGDPVQDAFKSSYTKEANSDFTGAMKDLKAVYSETNYELNLRLGWLSYSAGIFNESMAYYEKAIDLMPASVEAKFGYVYPAAAVGNWDQVKKQYENILKIDPKNTQGNYRLGLIHYGREEYDKALNLFQVGFNLYPFDYDFNLMMAWTSLKMGKMREAKVLFNKVLLLSPGDESATEGLGLIK